MKRRGRRRRRRMREIYDVTSCHSWRARPCSTKHVQTPAPTFDVFLFVYLRARMCVSLCHAGTRRTRLWKRLLSVMEADTAPSVCANSRYFVARISSSLVLQVRFDCSVLALSAHSCCSLGLLARTAHSDCLLRPLALFPLRRKAKLHL